MVTLEEVQNWRGKTIVDADGNKIGSIEEIYVDRQTGEPEWAAVKTGLFGTKHSFVPIADAQPTDDDKIRVPFQKEQVKNAPKVDADDELSPDEERQLYEHYGRTDYGDWQGEDRSMGTGLSDDADQAAGEPGVVGVRLRRVIVVAAPPRRI
jgi:sporulation protein YlmC with PRC-barrel domain